MNEKNKYLINNIIPLIIFVIIIAYLIFSYIPTEFIKDSQIYPFLGSVTFFIILMIIDNYNIYPKIKKEFEKWKKFKKFEKEKFD